MRIHENARDGLKQVFYGEIAMLINSLICLGGVAGFVFGIAGLVCFVLRNSGCKIAQNDQALYRSGQKILLFGLMINFALIVVAFTQKSFTFSQIQEELDIVVNIFSMMYITTATREILDDAGRTELSDRIKKTFIIYVVGYALCLFCILLNNIGSLLPEIVLTIGKYASIVFGVASSGYMLKTLRSVYPVI